VVEYLVAKLLGNGEDGWHGGFGVLVSEFAVEGRLAVVESELRKYEVEAMVAASIEVKSSEVRIIGSRDLGLLADTRQIIGGPALKYVIQKCICI